MSKEITDDIEKVVDDIEDTVDDINEIAEEPNIKRIPEIDFFKGIAVLSMVLFHIFYMANMMDMAKFPVDKGMLNIMARVAQLIFISCIGINLVLSRQKYKNKVEEFIRVDHAGERGAVKIYEGQLLALNTIVKNDDLKKKIEEMKVHEVKHCQFFENEIKNRNIKPTKFLPLWDLLGLGLGFGSTILGKKAAMLCTASVEEVIDEHYQDQINQLGPEEKNLKKKIIKFREDELHHKDIAYEKGATKKGFYSIMDKIIKTGSKIAIRISEKV